MTENLPALPTAQPSLTLAQQSRADLVDAVTDSWTAVVRDVAILAQQICDTEFVPKTMQGNPGKVSAAILYGREIGLPPMNSLAAIHVINGKAGVSAEVMRSMVLQAGHDFEVVEMTSARVTVRVRRRGTQSWTDVSWTQEDAKRAGLLKNATYTAYPRQMLMARASTELCRVVFPDVIHGLHSTEELEAMPADDVDEPAALAEPAPARRTVQRKRKPAPAAQPAPAQRDEAPVPEPPARQSMPLPTPADETPVEARPITEAQARAIVMQFDRLGITDRDIRLWMTDMLSGAWKDGQDVTSTNDLTYAQGKAVHDQLSGLRDRQALEAHIETLDAPDSDDDAAGEQA